MNSTISRITQLISMVEAYLSKATRQQLASKPSPKKWSKKEILGHLVDSALRNLIRFTEIQYKEPPFMIEDYEQDNLVLANNYHGVEPKDLTQLWVYLNKQIVHVIKQQTEKSLLLKAELKDKKTTNFLFLINDYLDHMEHHVLQLIKS